MSLEKVKRYLDLLGNYTKLHLSKSDLLTKKLLYCPCSTKYHGSYNGGLLDHLLNVVNISGRLAYSLYEELENKENIFEQLMFCSLIHDLGKLGNIENDFYLVNPDKNKRDKEPFVVNTNLVSMPHELRTLYWLDLLGINGLKEEELQAICYHAGPYAPGYLEAVRKEHPLLVLLHTADNLATKIMEA